MVPLNSSSPAFAIRELEKDERGRNAGLLAAGPPVTLAAMTDSRPNRHRQRAAACVVGAILMLTLGETLIKSRLEGIIFIAYWLTCFALTFAAMLFALRDLRHVRAENRARQRELIENTLREIEQRQRNPR